MPNSTTSIVLKILAAIGGIFTTLVVAGRVLVTGGQTVNGLLKEVTNIYSILRVKDGQILLLNAAINANTTHIAETVQQIIAAKEEIASLHKQNGEQAGQIAALNDRIKRLESDLECSEAELAVRVKELAAAQAEIAGKQIVIDDLHKQLETLTAA